MTSCFETRFNSFSEMIKKHFYVMNTDSKIDSHFPRKQKAGDRGNGARRNNEIKSQVGGIEETGERESTAFTAVLLNVGGNNAFLINCGSSVVASVVLPQLCNLHCPKVQFLFAIGHKKTLSSTSDLRAL